MVIGYSIGQCSSRETTWEGELYNSAVCVKDPLKSGFMKKLGMFWSEGRHQADAIRGRLPFIHPSSKPLSPHFIYKVQMGFTESYNWFPYYADSRRAETLPYSSWSRQHQAQYWTCSGISKVVSTGGMELHKSFREVHRSMRHTLSSNDLMVQS